MACTEVPLADRVLFGVLSREGMRTSEAANLLVRELYLHPNTTRAVSGSIGIRPETRGAGRSRRGGATALRRWLERRGELPPDALVFPDAEGNPRSGDQLVRPFRAALKQAKIDRPELFESNEARQQIRAHDLRATLVTLALANGKTEAWVADRTGHSDSRMINRYRRAAREVAELGLGELLPLAFAVPELQSGPQSGPRGTRQRAGKRS